MKQPWRVLIVILFVALLTLLLPGVFGDSAREQGRKLTNPITQRLHAAAIWLDSRYVNLTHIGQLYSERLALQSRVIELEQQVAALAQATHDNEILQKELAVRTQLPGWQRIQATVISRIAGNSFGEAIIDQGSRSGVVVGQAVTAQGMLVGKVSAVTSSTATITLVTSSRAQIQAELVDNQALGLVTGSPTGLHLIEIDPGVTLKSGMIVQTSGITVDGTMPRGLVIGQVDRVLSEPNQSTQTAIVHSPINFDQLRTVFIITPK